MAKGICIEDQVAYFEMARLGMAMVGQEICDEMDISDEEFLRLRDNLDKYMNEDDEDTIANRNADERYGLR